MTFSSGAPKIGHCKILVRMAKESIRADRRSILEAPDHYTLTTIHAQPSPRRYAIDVLPRNTSSLRKHVCGGNNLIHHIIEIRK